jgi:NAD-dependent oxidoreductase involved in siderophore biosynthesis
MHRVVPAVSDPGRKDHQRMKAFLLTADNHITAYASRALAQASLSEGAVLFASAAELAARSANWPSARLLQIWNSIPGMAPVRKFTDRKTGLARIWKAIQNLEPAPDAAPSQAPAAGSRPPPRQARPSQSACGERGQQAR